ncbi:hypothetical protein Q8X48_28800, partial [Pseudomonas sp. QLc11A]
MLAGECGSEPARDGIASIFRLLPDLSWHLPAFFSLFKLAETFHQVYKNGTTPRKAAAMTPLKLFVALSALSAASHAMAWDYVLLDTDKAARNWQITSQQLGIKTDKPFSVTLRTLHGGRQEGVSIVDIDNGTMKLSVVP